MRFDEWRVTGFDRDAATELYRSGINPLTAVFLCSRGITNVADANAFITDRAEDVLDPFLLRDMDKAVVAIEDAIAKGKKIAIFGDYDVDGMTSSALLKNYFLTRGVDCEIYIPGRAEEGYGLNRCALDYLKSVDTELIITVDCGITAIDEAVYTADLGIDLIITDHHECKDALPSAIAVINPKRPDCEYPNPALAGVGVAFKLVCALEKAQPLEKLLYDYADFVAIGTVADVMPVVGENRALIRAGLRRLAANTRPGLMAIMQAAKAPRTVINTADIGFVLAPRLNAAGRMGRTLLSVDILLTDDMDEARRLTEELCDLNTKRRELESAIFAQVEEKLRDVDPKGPIVMCGEDWHHGIMGIVAARTAERWLFPAIMINIDEDGIGRGSCRSFGRFKMYSALQQCDDLLVNYGGHEMAAGTTIRREDIEEFTRRIREIYHETVKIPPVPTLRVDFEVEKVRLLCLQNVDALSGLEPFGNQNLPPRLMITNARIALLSPVGNGKHTRMRIEKEEAAFDCIYFSVEAASLGVKESDYIDIVFEPQVNEFRGRRSVQLHVLDIKPHK